MRLAITEEVWFCHRCGESGDVITAVQWLEGLDNPKEAALFLLGETEKPRRARKLRKVEPPRKRSPAEIEAEERKRLEAVKAAVKALIVAAQKGTGSRRKIWSYLTLTKEKAIPERVIREALKRGFFYFLPDNPFQVKQAVCEHVPEDVLVNAGLLKEKVNQQTGEIRRYLAIIPRRPIMTPFRSRKCGITGTEFKTINGADPKSIAIGKFVPWWWKGETPDVLVTEGLTDFLSALGMGWRGCIFGLTGAPMLRRPEIIGLLRELRNQGRRIYLGLDNDGAGFKAVQAVFEAGLEVEGFFLPPEGKDLNDVLREGGRMEDIFQGGSYAEKYYAERYAKEATRTIK